jgi:hypothetical protein
MPSNFALKSMNGIHRLILGVTRGKAGWTAGNMPVLELTTIGRKSGKPRSCMLTSPIQEGESIVIVASRGGDDFHPAWYLNLVDNPQVQVRMWPIVEKQYKGYAGYQQRTDREIPLVILN